VLNKFIYTFKKQIIHSNFKILNPAIAGFYFQQLIFILMGWLIALPKKYSR
jgi:hypothetical protein